MEKEDYNLFTYNFGSTFNIDDNVTFYFKFVTKAGQQFYTEDEFFIVGKETTSAVSYSVFSLFTTVIYYISSKHKKVKK